MSCRPCPIVRTLVIMITEPRRMVVADYLIENGRTRPFSGEQPSPEPSPKALPRFDLVARHASGMSFMICAPVAPRCSMSGETELHEKRISAQTPMPPSFPSPREANSLPKCFAARQVRSRNAAGSWDRQKRPGPQHAYPSGRHESRFSSRYLSQWLLSTTLHGG
jgi:hypothetical protein